MAEYIDLDTPLELYVDRGGFYRQQITSLRELLNTNKIPYTAADVVERTQWIPVSERLPKEEETVLTWGKEHQCILLDWMHDNKWCCFGGADYWMPLPEPPEKESES